ncbi:hypothetical protein DFJ73DRAFT_177437 [Zopfochytrium polystomum]|nr:hypothetical protein DFJ73DRAFT_177437 [Zopfochytrium polystomum]
MGFMAARLNIGRLRYAANRLMDSNIELAHNYAFLIWGSADLILMVLLALNVLEYASQKSNPALQQGQFVLRTLLNSSIPRFAVIFINTLLICVVNFVVHYSNHDAIDYLTLQNVSKFAWMVKGSYTTLLLLDILMTRFLLYATPSGPAESEPRQSVSVNGVPMEAMDGCAPYGMQQQQQSARGVGGVGGGPDDGKLGGVPRRPTVILMPPLPALSPGATATENPYEPPRDPIPHYNSISSLLPRLGASSPRLASAPISATPPILASSSPGPLSPVASIHPIDSPRPAARGRNAAMAGGLERQLAFYPYREGVDTDEQDADSDGWWIAATTASEGSVTEIGSQGFIGYRPAVGVGRGDGL